MTRRECKSFHSNRSSYIVTFGTELQSINTTACLRLICHLKVHHNQGLNCQKISGGGVHICLFIVIVITHRQFSIINNVGGGWKLTPQGIPGRLVWGGVKQTTGGFNPPNPGNSNTDHNCDSRSIQARFDNFDICAGVGRFGGVSKS
jgi:hypothetical protein